MFFPSEKQLSNSISSVLLCLTEDAKLNYESTKYIPRSDFYKTLKEFAKVEIVALMQQSFLQHIKLYGSIKNIMNSRQGQM